MPSRVLFVVVFLISARVYSKNIWLFLPCHGYVRDTRAIGLLHIFAIRIPPKQSHIMFYSRSKLTNASITTTSTQIYDLCHYLKRSAFREKKKRPPGHTSCDDNTHDQISATSILPDNATYPENKE
jgi:hypothetical protein